MAEIELGILGRQCLSRRIDNIDDLRREAKALETARDTAGSKVDRQFTTEDARIKLKRLYPSIAILGSSSADCPDQLKPRL
jgi:phage host-nuclease inhibitor protein Gam